MKFFTNDNFSSRHDRFSILKILQKFGSLKKFDFLYHKSGPDHGKSRGYCFASYDNKAVSFKACADLEFFSRRVRGIISVVNDRKFFTNALRKEKSHYILYRIINMEVVNSDSPVFVECRACHGQNEWKTSFVKTADCEVGQ